MIKAAQNARIAFDFLDFKIKKSQYLFSFKVEGLRKE
jgi:hypothetical protein